MAKLNFLKFDLDSNWLVYSMILSFVAGIIASLIVMNKPIISLIFIFCAGIVITSINWFRPEINTVFILNTILFLVGYYVFIGRYFFLIISLYVIGLILGIELKKIFH